MLHEKYRPKAWSEVIGHGKVIAMIQRKIASNTLAGCGYWITGPSGSGKTTLARLIAAELAEPINIIELDAGQVTCATLNDLRPMLRTFGAGQKHGRVIVVNEAHGLRKDVIRQLLIMLEDIPGHVAWIFTTTGDGAKQLLFDGIDGGPLMSRCVPFTLDAVKYAPEFAKRAQEIAQVECLESGQAFEGFQRFAVRLGCNFRAMLSALEAGEFVREPAMA